MTATNLDTLPSELLSHICEAVYHSHKPSLCSLALANKTCESSASAFLFRDICFTCRPLSTAEVRPDSARWKAILTRRNSLENVRCVKVYGSFWPHAPARFRVRRQDVLRMSGWPWPFAMDRYQVHEEPLLLYEHSVFVALAELLRQLPSLETLHWAAMEQVPQCVVNAISQLRRDLRLEAPEWRLRLRTSGDIRPAQYALIKSPNLRSITAQIAPDDANGEVLLQMLSGATPSLEELRIVKCETVYSRDAEVLEGSRGVHLEAVPGHGEPRTKAALTLFSIRSKQSIEQTELEQWLNSADTSRLIRFELPSGVETRQVWSSTMRHHPMPRLRELRLGFKFDCEREHHDAAAAWIRSLNTTLKSLELCGNIPPSLVDSALKVHGNSLRKLTLDQKSHTGLLTLKFTLRDLERINSTCPSLAELTIPIQREIAVGNRVHEAQNYIALSRFAKLTHLRVTLDCARWGELDEEWILGNSHDKEYDSQEYYTLDTRRITYGHVRCALINAAIDDFLAKTIWDLIANNKVGLPLHELYLQSAGSTEIIRGFRPDDRPELAGRFVDLYAMLRELTRPYRVRRHVRDDIHEPVVSEPPTATPRGFSSSLSEEERRMTEVICHLNGSEMEIFRRIWRGEPRSQDWRDDWRSGELQASQSVRNPEQSLGSGTAWNADVL